ncbi:MAG: NTP transferase domain-containing protein [Chitinivibrionales bacterium]|nr:NTP transferase domain-containing protein [Chitinivibrionales bacterium]MBD3358605.1 NTP transferase domain-containing protein [Chitinivibrionales bacterium]
MKAILLAGGKGTRLRPYTNVLPKPLMPIGHFPILEIVLRRLRAAGITEVIICVGYLHHLLESYFGDGQKWDVRISYSREEEPLGTAGPISLVEGLDEDFLVMNGDILTDLPFEDLIALHKSDNAVATVTTYKKTVNVNLGVLDINGAGRIVDYAEKPVFDYWVSMGVYMFSPAVLTYLERGKYLDLPNLIRLLLNAERKVCCFRHEGTWFDLGRKEDYEAIATEEKFAFSLIPEAVMQ